MGHTGHRTPRRAEDRDTSAKGGEVQDTQDRVVSDTTMKALMMTGICHVTNMELKDLIHL